ncbi:NAD-dependent epimerase/dehydratase family protein [Synechococcus elongatus]|uniref:UDP-glucose 4-epimerase n=2 Tax=Synechococcus elongatus TaxID=32046 RepID=Q31M63_SYNE7|nr:NAD-dependent epimerase/dehydratase family protein [Synechococcus elongatus]ABB57856.1 mRNA-binding protein [Synechococcus elongatus PCC 7942 = FACHB-805]AJD57661.1 3-beta hydroxysteroid dehydrogenase [Synechococcus elongatus UTEX 2973]MBD2586572.1 NAD-dependent epimerase/dehydratase family protein [Synechococcus elongatus FACHB-242]MBD2687646.1 NAD-dependent epimerase/dehydratase family protein [Synechococcus elongatus FACHB-1061]MBD2706645.1 NAD-dependent epimerase/dehydratase family prot
MRILVIGGSRFIGVALVRQLLAAGHAVTVFNRGSRPALAGVEQLVGDRQDPAALAQLQGRSFDVVFDNTGREAAETQALVASLDGQFQQLIYVSSAGVYAASDQLPLRESDPVDPQSRHRGKFETENWLQQQGLPFTAFRPVYIYGPGNYNPLEQWFFDRILRDRPLPIPGTGLHLTQLGHVEDLATAMVAAVKNPRAIGQIYNLSGDRYVSFDGLARACAIAAGRDPQALHLVHYDPKQLNLGKRKAFPMRAQHFITAIDQARQDLEWVPRFSLIDGLQNSLQNDYLARGLDQQAVDFSLDEEILAAVSSSP